MAPEIYRGERYDSRADLYSLGIVLYKLRNHNRLPFLSLDKQLITYRDKENALTKRMDGEELPPPAEAGDIFAQVILKACAFNCKDRFSNAKEMRKALEDVRAGKIPEFLKEKAAEQAEDDSQSTASQTKPRYPDTENVSEEVSNESGTGRKNRTLMVSAIVLAVAVCVVFGTFAWVMRKDKKTKTSYDSQQLAYELNRIQERATTISEELNGYNWVEDPQKRIQYFDSSWQLMKVLVYPAASDEGVYEEYYYWYGKCFFAYIWTDETIDYYYYNKDGELIRWIDSNDVCHDYETDNDEYVERGERYWNNSVEEMERVQNAV
jgi:serine/threonine-protein kinase